MGLWVQYGFIKFISVGRYGLMEWKIDSISLVLKNEFSGCITCLHHYLLPHFAKTLKTDLNLNSRNQRFSKT